MVSSYKVTTSAFTIDSIELAMVVEDLKLCQDYYELDNVFPDIDYRSFASELCSRASFDALATFEYQGD